MSKFKVGDLVTAVESIGGLTQGETYTVSGFCWGTELVTLEGKSESEGLYTWRFNLAKETPGPKFKAGVRVTVAKGATYSRGKLSIDATVHGPGTIVDGNIDSDGDLRVRFDIGGLRWVNWSFITLLPEAPEVGDTIEVTFEDGTFATGVVSLINEYGRIWIGVSCQVGVGADDFAEYGKVVKKAEKPTPTPKPKPKVWAVGDRMEGDDYASSTVKPGTIAGPEYGSIIKIGEDWVSIADGSVFSPVNLSAARTIAYIP